MKMTLSTDAAARGRGLLLQAERERARDEDAEGTHSKCVQASKHASKSIQRKRKKKQTRSKQTTRKKVVREGWRRSREHGVGRIREKKESCYSFTYFYLYLNRILPSICPV